MKEIKFFTPFRVLPRILEDLAAHIVLAVCGSLTIFLTSKNAVYSAVFFSASLLLDLDHILDYFIYFRGKLNVSAFLNGLSIKSGKVYVFLHSWEIPILILVSLSLTASPLVFVFFLGLAGHLAIDNIQRQNPFFYFFFYRLSKKFNTDILLPEYNTVQDKKLFEEMYASVFANDRRHRPRRCKKCKVPLEGFLYRNIALKLFGVQPSAADAELCNKCEVKR